MGVEDAFADALRESRKAAGLSQEKLAEKASVDRTYISLLERGLRQPTLSTLIHLADALDLTPSLLLDRTLHYLKNESP
ncbi:helix-turn-helix domain-containing protein [Endozoicomonas sp. 2B-B]